MAVLSCALFLQEHVKKVRILLEKWAIFTTMWFEVKVNNNKRLLRKHSVTQKSLLMKYGICCRIIKYQRNKIRNNLMKTDIFPSKSLFTFYLFFNPWMITIILLCIIFLTHISIKENFERNKIYLKLLFNLSASLKNHSSKTDKKVFIVYFL